MNITQEEIILLGISTGLFIGFFWYIAAAFFTPFFESVKKGISYTSNLIFGSVVIATDIVNRDGAVHVVEFLVKNSEKVYELNRTAYSNEITNIKALGLKKQVFFSYSGETNYLFVYKGAFILHSRKGEEYSQFHNFRGGVDWEKLLYQVSAESDGVKSDYGYKIKYVPNLGLFESLNKARRGGLTTEEDSTSLPVRGRDGEAQKRPIGYEEEELGEDVPLVPLATISITPQMKTIIDDASFWVSHKSWFIDRGLTWKRGYCLYGRPGTGKTTVVRTIAQHLNMPLVVFSLANLRDSESFLQYWNDEMRSSYPKIILFEDFDTVFDGRVALGHLSFETVLNAIDGVARDNGRILFVTTNHVEKIDPAMLRPGRIDVCVKFDNMDLDGLFGIARKIMLGMSEQEITDTVDANSHSTPAEFQEVCVQKALECFKDKARHS